MSSTHRFRAVASALAAAALVAGCAVQSNSNEVYYPGQVQREQIVRFGIVESVRPVTIQHRESGVGTLGGAAVGGGAGSAIGAGRGSVVGAVVGAVAGGIAGNAIENAADRRAGYELTVRLDDGS